MKKQVVLGMIATLALSTSVALASPMEMNEGQWNVNMGVMFSPDSEWDGDESWDLDGDTSFYGGVTYGITDRWGVQVDYSHYDADDQELDIKVDATEYNVLYKIDPHLTAFAGYIYVGDKEKNIDDDGVWKGGYHTDGFQAGLMGWYPLADKFKTFGKVGLGNNSRVYEIGFSYAVADNWDLDLSYRDVEYKDFENVDISFDGVRLGLSTSF